MGIEIEIKKIECSVESVLKAFRKESSEQCISVTQSFTNDHIFYKIRRILEGSEIANANIYFENKDANFDEEKHKRFENLKLTDFFNKKLQELEIIKQRKELSIETISDYKKRLISDFNELINKFSNN